MLITIDLEIIINHIYIKKKTTKRGLLVQHQPLLEIYINYSSPEDIFHG